MTERLIFMQGKDIAKASALFFTGLTAGYLLAKHIGIGCCCEEADEDRDRKPPLHVKPVPISKKNGADAESSEHEETL